MQFPSLSEQLTRISKCLFSKINDLEWLEIIFSAGPPPLEDFPKNVKNVESTKICLFNMLTFVSATI